METTPWPPMIIQDRRPARQRLAVRFQIVDLAKLPRLLADELADAGVDHEVHATDGVMTFEIHPDDREWFFTALEEMCNP